MKNLRILFTITLIALFASSCKKDSASSEYDKSLSAWQNYKATLNNSYKYKIVHDVPESYSGETTITVVNDVIIKRDFVYYEYQYVANTNSSARVLTKEWHETETTIGTHGTEAGDLFTIDDIYYQAKNNWLKANKIKNEVIFETKNYNGVVSTVGYIPKDCQDDCFIGVKITSIVKYP